MPLVVHSENGILVLNTLSKSSESQNQGSIFCEQSWLSHGCLSHHFCSTAKGKAAEVVQQDQVPYCLG